VSARCSLVYGQHPHTTECYSNSDPMPTDGRPTFMDSLSAAGYFTHGIGKCHFKPDAGAMRGFKTRLTQEELVKDPGADDYLKFIHDKGYRYISDPCGPRGEMYYVPQVSQLPAKYHPTQWIGDNTVAFIEKRASSDEPWFCFSSYIHPHPPFSPPNPWHKLYRAPLMPLPLVPQDSDALLAWVNHHQNRYKYRDQGIDRNLVRCLKAYYYATVSFVDYQVGRTLDALEKTGQLDNTLVIFTADHGEYLGDYNSFGKRGMHDASSRVPLIVRFPASFAPGARCAHPASLVDVAATIVTSAGADMPGLEGTDLAEVAAGAGARRTIISQWGKAGRASYMAVNDRWKYFYSVPDDREFLFDRRQDPQETRNLAGVSFRRPVRDEMKRTLIDLLATVGETDAVDGKEWRKYPRLEMPADPDAGLLIQDHPWADTGIPGYTD